MSDAGSEATASSTMDIDHAIDVLSGADPAEITLEQRNALEWILQGINAAWRKEIPGVFDDDTLFALRTEKGGITGDIIAALGVEMRKGWFQNLKGTPIPNHPVILNKIANYFMKRKSRNRRKL